MNKTLIIILPLTFCLLYCSNKKTFYDRSLEIHELEYWGITGPVKSFVERGFYRNEKAKDIDLNNLALKEDFRFSSKQQCIFNKDGLMSDRNYYYSEESLSWQHLISYNNKNRRLNEIVLKGDTAINYFTEFIYDKAGNQIQEVFYKEDSTVWVRKIFTYNDQNQQTEEKWTEKKLGPQVHRIYELDKKGRVKIMNYTDGQNDLKFVHSYTKTGNPASIIAHYPDETIEKKETFKYQDERLIEIIRTNYKRGSRHILHLNPKGLLYKVERFKLEEEEDYEFEEYLFEYDERGNWIRKAIFHGKELFDVVFREIEYF